MKKQALYLLTFCGLLFACKKEPLPKSDETDSPVFYAKCNVNGLPVKIEAGVNDYFMNSSYSQDENNLYVYKGEIKQNTCTSNCGFAIAILINDFKYSEVDAQMDVSRAIKAGTYGFINENIKTYYSCQFLPKRLAPDNNYSWLVGDNTNAIASTNVTGIFEAGKIVPVTLTASDAAGTAQTFTKNYKVGDLMQADISMEDDAGNSLFSVNPKGKAPYDYLWRFGDGSTSTDASPTHRFASSNSSYTTILTLVDARKDTSISTYRVGPGPDVNFKSVYTPVINPKLLSATTIHFTDQNGIVYSSANLDQPAGSKFEIISVEDYKTNNNQESTKKVKIRFSCSFTSNNGIINITDGEAVIAVSYK